MNGIKIFFTFKGYTDKGIKVILIIKFLSVSYVVFFLTVRKMDLIYSIDLVGTFVFAISGALAAAEKKFDVFGGAILALVTAVGGGTLRDVLIGSTPVGWMQDHNYIFLVILAVAVSYFFRKHVLKLRKTLFLFDTIGIGLFTILGLQKTLDMGLSPLMAIIMGAVSAVFGGVVRDVLSTEVPLIFRKEIYATACLGGGMLFVLLEKGFGDSDWNILIAILVVILVRIIAVKKNWSLPKLG